MLLTNLTTLKDEKQLKERIKSCESCPHYSAVHVCTLCKCFMPIKHKFLYAKCPENKWPPIDNLSDLTIK